jgi:hypothetical protein
LFLAACSNKKSDNPPIVDLKQGTWRVSFYWDKKDETSNFTTYAFMFSDGGVLMAHQGASMFTGTWSESNGRLNINFADVTLSKLNNNWLITEKTSSSLKLKDDNPSQDDQLHFTKN